MKKEQIENFGDFIKALLMKENKKVAWLAEELGYKDASTLYKALNKPSSFTVETLLKMSKLLNYNLFNYFADRKQEDDEKKEDEEKKSK